MDSSKPESRLSKMTQKGEDKKTGLTYRMTKTKPANFDDLRAKFNVGGGINSTTNVKNTKISSNATKSEVQTRSQRNSPLRASQEKTEDDIKDLLSGTKFTISGKDNDDEPQVAVSRVFRGSGNKVCKATVENKLHRQDSGEMSLVPTNKSTATSILSANLALARVRPGPPKKEETTTNSNNTIQSSFNALSKYSKTTTSHNETNSSETKTGYKSNTSKYSSNSSIPSEPESGFSKFTSDTSMNKLSRTNSSGSDLSDTRSNLSRNNSFNQISANSKPRPFSPSSSISSEASVTTTRTIKTQFSLTRTASSGSVDTRPEWLETRERLVSNFQTRLKHKPGEKKTESKASSTVRHSKLKIMKSDGDRILSNSEVKQKYVSKTLEGDRIIAKQDKNISQREPQSPCGTQSPTGNQSPRRVQSPRESTSSKDSQKSRAEIDEYNEICKNIFKRRESEKEIKQFDCSHSFKANKPNEYETRKMTAEYFKKIKSGFEQPSSESTSSHGRKPKIQVNKTLVERKHSYDTPKSPTSPSRQKTLKRLQEDGQMPSVRAVSSALNLEFGRQRAASTGSITADIYTDNIYEAMGEVHYDVEGNEKYEPKAWPDTDSTSSDNEGIYDYIKDTDPKGKVERRGLSKAPTRRNGQRSSSVGKDMNRPSFDNQEDINHHDPSSSEITEGSSKEGTMESTDERGGIDGDIEYDTDSSENSGIYEPINPELKKKQEEKSSDLPQELPANRKKKKNQKEKSDFSSSFY